MSLKYQGMDLQDLSNAFKIEFARGATKVLNFKLTSPVSASVKHADGRYSKVSFVGNEEFRLASSYVGKKNGIIITFIPKLPVTYAQMELSLDEAVRVIDANFKRLVENVINKIAAEGDEVSQAVMKNKEASENESRVRLMADPRYGAW